MLKKSLLPLSLLIVLATVVLAQVPQQFSYQGALRSATGTPLANQAIQLRLSILDGSATGASQYSEERRVTTNQLGLYSVSIGSTGALTTTNNFSSIAWGSGLKYIKVEVDVAGGSNYVTAGASQLLSVPYAIYAANSGTSGSTGAAGADGKSAYQIWQQAGNTGTEADFLTSLKGADGAASVAGGDLSGTLLNSSVVKIQGVSVSAAVPTASQILRFNGTTWEPYTLPGTTVADVTTSSTDVLQLTNGTGAALQALTIDIKPGAVNTTLTTDDLGVVKWVDGSFVSGKIYDVTISAVIPANETFLVTQAIADAEITDKVFITPFEDNADFSVLSSYVSAAGVVRIRLANYQPIPYSLSNIAFKILIIK